MSKALVIKGANFVQNAVEQISVSEPVPCTGIIISRNTLDFTEIGATSTLTATLTPADTTDTVVWHSSDENVATVANGVVTCVGVGEATITAACGTQAALCTVSATVTLDGENDLSVVHHYQLSVNGDRDYFGAMETVKYRTYFANSNLLSGYKAISGNIVGNIFDTKYGQPIPRNAKSVRMIVPKSFTIVMFGLQNANELATYNISNPGARRRLYTYSNNFVNYDNDYKYTDFDISDIDTAINSFIVTVGSGSLTDEETQVLIHPRLIFS